MAQTAHPLIRRWHALCRLSQADQDALLELVPTHRLLPAQTDLVQEGDVSTNLHVMIEGFACRYKIVDGGKRQIVAYLLPGDVCDPDALLGGVMDHGVLMLAESRIAEIEMDALNATFDDRPTLFRAFLRSILAGESLSREWLANMGRRSPDKRIGHLLCEMLARLRAVGLADDDRFAFPITQADLGDTIGLSTVHVNRTLQDLKEKRLIASKRGVFEVLDLRRLQEFADFDPTYLQISAREAEAVS